MPRVTLNGRGVRFHPDTPGQPGADLRRRAVRPGPGRLAKLVHGHQQPAPAAHGPARPLPAPQPIAAGLRRHARHPRPRRRLQGPSHQPVRGLARGTDRTPCQGARCTAFPLDGTGARRLHHLGVQPGRLRRRPVPGCVSRQHVRLRPGQQPGPSRYCWNQRGRPSPPGAARPIANSSPPPTPGSGRCT